MIVFDASYLTELLLGSPDAIEAFDGVGAAEHEPFHAPALIEIETLHALRGMARGGHVSEERAAAAVADLGRARRVLYPTGPFVSRVWELRHQLTAYDALYLAVAERIGAAALVTADAGLAARSRALLGADRVRLI